jgi:hypothetical protein
VSASTYEVNNLAKFIARSKNFYYITASARVENCVTKSGTFDLKKNGYSNNIILDSPNLSQFILGYFLLVYSKPKVGKQHILDGDTQEKRNLPKDVRNVRR